MIEMHDSFLYHLVKIWLKDQKYKTVDLTNLKLWFKFIFKFLSKLNISLTKRTYFGEDLPCTAIVTKCQLFCQSLNFPGHYPTF